MIFDRGTSRSFNAEVVLGLGSGLGLGIDFMMGLGWRRVRNIIIIIIRLTVKARIPCMYKDINLTSTSVITRSLG
jgi:hypothetical protein